MVYRVRYVCDCRRCCNRSEVDSVKRMRDFPKCEVAALLDRIQLCGDCCEKSARREIQEVSREIKCSAGLSARPAAPMLQAGRFPRSLPA
jgi:hypothetical protein